MDEMLNERNYAIQSAQQTAMGAGQLGLAPTMRQRIELAVKQAEAKLADTQRAKELFDKNPDLEELLNIMQRSHF